MANEFWLRVRRSRLWWVPATALAFWLGLALGARLPGTMAVALSAGVAIGAGILVLLAWRPNPAVVGFLVTALLVFTVGYVAQHPSNHGHWSPDVALPPSGTFRGDQLVIRQYRDCHYRTVDDFDVRYETRTFDLQRLQGLDLFLMAMGSRHMAHPMLSFDFGQGERLVLSIEFRRGPGETFDPARGLFRRWPLCIVAGSERDLVRVRTNLRMESVRLYHLNASLPVVKEILRDYVLRMNRLTSTPEWYNSLTDNCTTAILSQVRRDAMNLPWSWKFILSGHMDEVLYDRGILPRSLPLETLRARSVISSKARLADQDPEFSTRIREGLPTQ